MADLCMQYYGWCYAIQVILGSAAGAIIGIGLWSLFERWLNGKE